MSGQDSTHGTLLDLPRGLRNSSGVFAWSMLNHGQTFELWRDERRGSMTSGRGRPNTTRQVLALPSGGRSCTSQPQHHPPWYARHALPDHRPYITATGGTSLGKPAHAFLEQSQSPLHSRGHPFCRMPGGHHLPLATATGWKAK